MFDGLNSSGITLPVWFAGVEVPDFPTLNKNINTDVCIIGAGIAGLTTAYLLSQAGREVVVIDDGKICSGESGRTTGHLASGIDDHYFELERVFGEEGAKLAAQSHMAAIDQIEEIVKQEKINCEFKRVDGYLFLDPKNTIKFLQKELVAAHRAGLKTAELLEKPHTKGFDIGPCIRFPHQAQLHILKYLAPLAEAVVKQGGKIFAKTHAHNIEIDTTSHVKISGGHSISAKAVVIATNAPIYDSAMLFTKQEANRTYVIGACIPKGSVEQSLFWDTGDPYHYVRIEQHPEKKLADILIFGGEDHRTGEKHVPEEKFKYLTTWANAFFPQIESIDYAWSGQIMEPADHLAFIGQMPSKKGKVFVATGDSGNGLTHGTIAGMLLTDLITEKANPWAKIYSPTRKPLKNLKTYLTENIISGSEYREYLTPGEAKDVREIPDDSGAIMRKGMKKIAVYRDKQSKLHECSAMCSHMGGILTWNAVEHTWDCPVHGSRFTPDGDVINGPARNGLKKK